MGGNLLTRRPPRPACAAVAIGNVSSWSARTAVVVGAGPNGLAAAITLARAGHAVEVFEGAATVGGGTRTEALTLPGFRHDVCSAVHPSLVASPFFADLDLRALGITLRQPEVAYAHPLGGGRAAALYRDVEETASHLGGDAAAYRGLMDPLVQWLDRIVPYVLGPDAHGAAGPARSCPLRARSARPRRSAPPSAFTTDAGARPGRRRGRPLHAAPDGSVDRRLRPVARRAGPRCRVARRRGRERGDHRRDGRRAAPSRWRGPHRAAGSSRWTSCRRPVPSCSTRHRASSWRWRDHDCSRRAARPWAHFRPGPGTCKVDWALDGPVPWAAEACRRTVTVHVGGTFDEVARSEAAVRAGRHADRPFVLVAQPSCRRSDPRPRRAAHACGPTATCPTGRTWT